MRTAERLPLADRVLVALVVLLNWLAGQLDIAAFRIRAVRVHRDDRRRIERLLCEDRAAARRRARQRT
jgi:hypothetical protein